jgi:hypothetical protein
MPKRTVQFQGTEVQGEGVEFETEREAFNSYLLQDGTTLKLKSVVIEIVRLDQFNRAGDPVYVIRSQNIVAAVVPENLKKKV